MNKALDKLPQIKQDELDLLAELLSAFKEVELVILFGSYARGNWTEDRYVEKGITYEYKSDFDILIALTYEDIRKKFRIEDKVKNTPKTKASSGNPRDVSLSLLRAHVRDSSAPNAINLRDLENPIVILNSFQNLFEGT